MVEGRLPHHFLSHLMQTERETKVSFESAEHKLRETVLVLCKIFLWPRIIVFAKRIRKKREEVRENLRKSNYRARKDMTMVNSVLTEHYGFFAALDNLPTALISDRR